MPIHVITADITRLSVDAIVNAANSGLLGGGGVDGAIHRTAGPRLLAACRALPEVAPGVRCPTGEARITPGFGLPARHVIHTVGPVWHGGQQGEPALLADCYRHALQLLRKAMLLAPGSAGIRWHLAQALADAGETAAARQAIAQVLADPAFADRAPATALLRSLGG